ncbi:MAG: 2-hydroxyacyl-CoA dehydratase family protein [Dehalococcoidia bacterium]|jgi:benzoyl-CoA reductase/2-hydroxyglutaryl-CoA dehydratase subunit BcrC/BadD/HgdB
MTQRIDLIQDVYEKLKTTWEDLDRKDPAKKWTVEPALIYIKQAYEGIKLGKPLIWYFIGLPPEIFRAMDVAILCPEFACAVVASLGMARKYLEIAEVRITQEFCAANKFPAGLAFSADTKLPDMMVYAPAHPCDAASTVYANLNHCLKIPSFYLDLPYTVDERAVKYVAKELRKMISFMETQTNQKFDWDRLREVIGYSNQALAYTTKINELKKIVPSPLSTRGAFTCGAAMLGLAGASELPEYLKHQYELAQKKAEMGKGGIPNEKIRCIWIHAGFDFDTSIFDWLESKYGAVAVARLWHMLLPEPIDNTGDEAKMLEGIATRTLRYPMARQGRGPVSDFADECISIARDYKANAVISAGNNGCRYHWAVIQLVKDRIYDELGIPTLSFEMSQWDPRVASTETIKAIFDQFFESLV